MACPISTGARGWRHSGIVALFTVPGTCAIACIRGWAVGCACYQSPRSRCSGLCIVVVNVLKPLYIFIGFTPMIVRGNQHQRVLLSILCMLLLTCGFVVCLAFGLRWLVDNLEEWLRFLSSLNFFCLSVSLVIFLTRYHLLLWASLAVNKVEQWIFILRGVWVYASILRWESVTLVAPAIFFQHLAGNPL